MTANGSATPDGFLGYVRADGSVGVRNYLLILSVGHLTGPSARRVARALPLARLVMLPYWGGMVGADRELSIRHIEGFCTHPNVGAALLIGSDGPRLQELLARVTAAGRLAQALCLDDCEHDALVLSDRALRMGAGILRDISRQRRVPVPLSALFLGVKCGRSDPSSGIASNPLIGHVADALVDAGGRVVFGETMEWLGAEHLLARRAISPEVGASLVGAVRRREELAVLNGVDLVGDNPNPTNVAAGISTIEEKSLGSVAKSGSRLIDGIVPMGARIDRPGLFAMDGPAYSPESLSGLVASGAQIVLFSTGVGNSYVSRLAPTVKLSANPAAAAVLRQQLDYDASGVLLGTLEPPQAARALLETLLEVASGSLTWGEVLDEGDEVVSRIGEAL